jgi:hypothetical protein
VKKSTIIIIVAVLIVCSFAFIKLSQKNLLPFFLRLNRIVSNLNMQSLIHQETESKMFSENQDLINRVITLCENAVEDENAFATKAWLIMEDQLKWSQKYASIRKQKPELIAKIDERWMDLIYALGSSIDNDSNELRKEKKAAAMGLIENKIKPETIVNYLKNKPGITQEMLNDYIQNKTEAKKLNRVIRMKDFLKE